MAISYPFTPEQQAEAEGIERKRRIADALLKQGLTPQQGQMVGGYYVAPNPLQNVLSGIGGMLGNRRADEQQKELVARAGQGRQDELARLAETPSPQAMMQSQYPDLQAAGMSALAAQQKPLVVGRSIMTGSGNLIGTDPSVAAEGDARRAASAEQAEAARLARETQAASEQRFRQEQSDRDRLFRADQAERDRQARQDNIRLAAELRPPAAERPLTEMQGKSALFGSRAALSDRLLNSLEDSVSTTGLAVKQAAAGMPIIGGIAGALGNVALSPEQQQVEQAQRDFVNAILRQESGATIQKEEFENAKKQYFPAPGDRPEVIQQKRLNRQTAIQGLRTMAGPAGVEIDNALKNTPDLKPKKEPRSRGTDAPPAGIAPEVWAAMTAEERALFRQ